VVSGPRQQPNWPSKPPTGLDQTQIWTRHAPANLAQVSGRQLQ
jgi:hypothetical protein